MTSKNNGNNDPEVGADLEPEEAADALATKESTKDAPPVREDRRDDDIISLDTPD